MIGDFKTLLLGYAFSAFSHHYDALKKVLISIRKKKLCVLQEQFEQEDQIVASLWKIRGNKGFSGLEAKAFCDAGSIPFLLLQILFLSKLEIKSYSFVKIFQLRTKSFTKFL